MKPVLAALAAGALSVHPFLRTPARDATLIGVTQGLMGRRILLNRMVASGGQGLDDLALGAAQVLYEAARHPEIAVERTLVLDYDADLILYVNPRQADVAGLIYRYFGTAIRQLDLGNRLTIRLSRPD